MAHPLRHVPIAIASTLAMLLIACNNADTTEAPALPTAAPTSTAQPTPTQSPVPTNTPVPAITPAPTSDPDNPFSGEWDNFEAAAVWEWLKEQSWNTDFRYRTVNRADIKSYNIRDRIVPIDHPDFSQVSSPPDYMRPDEPVVSVVINGEAKAYPLTILMWHEIVNDVVGGKRVTMTYRPLCNTAILFDSDVAGHELTFGTTGKLRNGDLVMWDRDTESWWQQVTGAAIVGDFARTKTVLEIIPVTIIPWSRFVRDFPDGQVLNRQFDDEGEPLRSYHTAPYLAYDNSDRRPFAFDREVDRRLIGTSRVLTLNDDDSAVVYPFDFLAENPVLNDVIDGQAVVAVFDDRTLTFEIDPDGMIDTQTGATWTISGRALRAN